MRVLIINTSEKTGGAAIAARRLMESLYTAGTDVKMLVLHKESQSEQVISVGKNWQKKIHLLMGKSGYLDKQSLQPEKPLYHIHSQHRLQCNQTTRIPGS